MNDGPKSKGECNTEITISDREVNFKTMEMSLLLVVDRVIGLVMGLASKQPPAAGWATWGARAGRTARHSGPYLRLWHSFSGCGCLCHFLGIVSGNCHRPNGEITFAPEA